MPARHRVGKARIVLAVDREAGAPRQFAQHRRGHHAGRAVALDDRDQAILRQRAHRDPRLVLFCRSMNPRRVGGNAASGAGLAVFAAENTFALARRMRMVMHLDEAAIRPVLH